MKTRSLALVATGALAVGGALAASGAGAADHLDAPGVAQDGRTDINDLYAFQSPTNADNTVLIMTVNPAVGIFSGDTFRPGADYSFHIDQDGDAVADRVATVKFNGATKKGQSYKLQLEGGPTARGQVAETSAIRGGGQITVGTFEDPFFFDLTGFRGLLDGDPATPGFTGSDFFAGLDVSAIVIEVPSSWVTGGGDSNVAVWASTSIDGAQIDRIGRPAINTVLIPSNRKNEFNQADPRDDFAAFGDDVRATIAALNGGDTETAAALTAILLPDVLTVDVSSTAGFLNGRQLADDVIDAELGILTNNGVTGDGVDANDVPFLNQFPYLAPANG